MDYPAISCVVIGVNVQKTIRSSLEAVKKSDYPKPLEIIYVDGGSSDNSVEIVRQVGGIKVIELRLDNPTPGKGRNAGWRAASNEWIQFLDGDAFIDPLWLRKAAENIDDTTAIVFGRRQEIFPRKNWYHLAAEIGWMHESERSIGGDILCRRKSLEETGGYVDFLVGGADPELGIRIRKAGWKIKKLKEPMCFHDIAAKNFARYWRRSMRVGRAYIEAGVLMAKRGEKDWVFRALKISLKICLLLGLLVCALALKEHLFFFTLVFAVNFFPVTKTFYFMRTLGIPFREALIYALHCSVVIWPQFFGILSYFLRLNANVTKK